MVRPALLQCLNKALKKDIFSVPLGIEEEMQYESLYASHILNNTDVPHNKRNAKIENICGSFVTSIHSGSENIFLNKLNDKYNLLVRKETKFGCCHEEYTIHGVLNFRYNKVQLPCYKVTFKGAK